MDLSEFDLELQFRPGKYHFLSDWISRAELIDMDMEGMLSKEIQKLEELHEYNKVGLLAADLKQLKSPTNNVAQETSAIFKSTSGYQSE